MNKDTGRTSGRTSDQSGRSGRSAGRGRGRGGRGNNEGRSGRSAYRRSETDSKVALPIIHVEGTTMLTLKPILLEWVTRNYPKLLSVIKKNAYLVPQPPSKQKIKERWRAAQRGDLTAALGIEGVRFDDGTPLPDADNYEDEHVEDEEEHMRVPLRGRPDEDADEFGGAEAAPVKERQGNAAPDDDLSDEAVNKAFDSEHLQWVKEISKFNEQRKTAFEELWGKCGAGMKSAIKSNDDWEIVEASQDFLKLIKMICVALVARGATDARTRKMYTKKAYDGMCMFAGETLDKFKERFDDALSQMRSSGIRIDEEQAADDFLLKLDDRFKNLLEIQTRTGYEPGDLYEGRRASTVREVFILAQSEVNRARTLKDRGMRPTGGVRSGTGNTHGAAFTGQKMKAVKPGKSDGTKCSKCNGSGHSATDCTSNDWSTVECFGCGGVGHYKSECASKPRPQDEIEKTSKA